MLFCPVFSPVKLTGSDYTQDGPKQKSTGCYCRLWILSYIQRKVSTGGQLVSQAWCALKVIPQRKLCQVCCVIFCRDTCSVSVRHCICTAFQMQLVCAVCTHSTNYCRQTHTHTHTHTHIPMLHTVCVCDTALLQFVTLNKLNCTLYFSVPLHNISPHISQLPPPNTNCYTH